MICLHFQNPHKNKFKTIMMIVKMERYLRKTNPNKIQLKILNNLQLIKQRIYTYLHFKSM